MHEYVHVVKAPPSGGTGLCRISPKLVALVTSRGRSRVRPARPRPRPGGPASRRLPRPAQVSEDPFDAACSFNFPRGVCSSAFQCAPWLFPWLFPVYKPPPHFPIACFILQLSLIIPTCFVYIPIIYSPIFMFYFLFIYFG